MRTIGVAVLAGLAMLALAEAARADNGVLVLRGTPGPRPAPMPEPARSAPAVVAGERLWLVDPEGGRLAACRLERTSRIGERRIRCTERPLPRGRG
ncbi:MAG: hypothetical protein RMK81_07380 [Geminicoccaceae bacterium]|nr:hypothetical protein [Geminicoccaceae bacterium]MDW8370077.1 hypothetical protein [Geminicoccaceae bacterium]